MHCITVCGKFDIAKDARNCCKGDLKKLFHFRTKVGGGRRVQLVLKRSSSFPFLSGGRTCDDGRSNGSRAHRRGAGAAAAPLLLLRAISESSSSSHGGEGSPIRRGGDGEEQKENKKAAAVPPRPTSSSSVLQKSEHYWALRILTEVALIWRSLQYSSIRFDYWLASLQTTNRGKYILRTSSSRERSASASLLQTKAAAAAAAREEEAHGVVIAEVRIRSNRQQRSGREQQERYSEFRELQGEDDSRYSSSSTHGRLQGALFKNLKKALPQLEERTQGFAVSQWLHRLSKTYGTPFMVLVVLGYCTQGFRCFPWLAMSYYFKDNLQVCAGFSIFSLILNLQTLL